MCIRDRPSVHQNLYSELNLTLYLYSDTPYSHDNSLYSCLLYTSSRALREDARPGNREPVRLQVHLFQQCNILCPAVVAVAGDIPGITVLC